MQARTRDNDGLMLVPQLVAVVLFVAAAVLGYVASAQAAPTVTEIDITDFAFSPAVADARGGDLVEFHNNGASTHRVVFDAGNASQGIQPGATWSLTFSDPGVYPFHCEIHPQMTGTLRVSGGTASTVGTAASDVSTPGELANTGATGSLAFAAVLCLLGGAAALVLARRTPVVPAWTPMFPNTPIDVFSDDILPRRDRAR